MEPPMSQLIEVIERTDYFQDCLEDLLSVLQPSYYCLNLIIKVLLHGPDGSGKRLLAKVAAANLNMNLYEERVADLFDENIVGTEKKVRATIAKAVMTAPCLVYLTGFELFCKLEDSDLSRIEHCINETFDNLIKDGLTQPIVFIASTKDYNSVYHGPLSNMFQHELIVRSPSYEEALDITHSIKASIQSETIEPSKILANHSNGEYYLGNIIDSIASLEVDSLLEKSDEDHNTQTNEQLDGTRWTDIGGLSGVKREIIDAIQLSIDYPQLKKSGLKRTGILLYGPPGTGKTLLARAVATECSLNFINVKGPELLNEYVGQSEDNVRKLFQKARESSPSVIFFDELDSLAPNRGQAGDSGGVMDRMVSQILAEMDGVGKSDSVFVIGATNRVDLVDPSLLRPGRFDKVLEVPLPSGKDNRIQILEALTRKMQLSEDVDLELIESKSRSNMSGADFKSLCSRALHRTFDRVVEQVETGKLTEDEVVIVTTLDDFLQSMEESM